MSTENEQSVFPELPRIDLQFILFHRPTQTEIRMPVLGICDEYSQLTFGASRNDYGGKYKGIGRLPSGETWDELPTNYDVFVEIGGKRFLYDGIFAMADPGNGGTFKEERRKQNYKSAKTSTPNKHDGADATLVGLLNKISKNLDDQSNTPIYRTFKNLLEDQEERACIEHSKDQFYSADPQYRNIAQRAFTFGAKWMREHILSLVSK